MITCEEAQHRCDAVDQIGSCILSKTLQRNLLFHLTDCATEINFPCYLRPYCGMLPNSSQVYAYMNTYIRRYPLITRAPLGSGHFAPPPLRSREPRNVASSGKRRWIALGVNSLKHVHFLKIEVTGQVKLRSKVKYYSFYNGAY